jgi:hypothetical protein
VYLPLFGLFVLANEGWEVIEVGTQLLQCREGGWGRWCAPGKLGCGLCDIEHMFSIA